MPIQSCTSPIKNKCKNDTHFQFKSKRKELETKMKEKN